MKIRKATIKDLDQLTELYSQYYDDLNKITPKRFQFFKKRRPSYKNEIKKSILKDLKDRSKIIIVAEDKELIATVSGLVKPILSKEHFDKIKFGYLQYLFVEKTSRDQNISKLLEVELIKWFKTRNCDYVRLEVASTNPAKRIYEKWGFESDSIKMIKKLK